MRRSCSPGATTAPDSIRPNTSSYHARYSRSCGRMSGLTFNSRRKPDADSAEELGSLVQVDPARAGPAVKTPRLRLLASRASRVGGLRAFGPGPNAGPGQNILRRLGREIRPRRRTDYSAKSAAVAFWRKCDKSPSTRTGRAKPVTRARENKIETSGPAALCRIGL